MNGRVYDPGIGRFLSPDTIVQAPKDTQSYNRYAYVKNNPLKYTDPSGHSWLSSALRSVSRFMKSYGAQVVSIAIAVFAPEAWSVWQKGLLSGFAGGLVGSRGDLSAAIRGGLFGAISAGIADQIGHGVFKGGDDLWMGIKHGFAQGAIAELRGGEFKDGFLSGSVGHWAGVWAKNNMTDLDIYGRTAVAAIAGGLASVAGGGKFANGAVTAAFVHLFNQEGVGEEEGGGSSDELEETLLKNYLHHEAAGINDCGDYVVDVARDLGIKDIGDLGYEASADDIIAKAGSVGETLTIDNAAEIQKIVDSGGLVIMGVTSAGIGDGAIHGHVAIVRPKAWKLSGQWGGKVPIVANRALGRTPSFTMGSNYAFKSSYKSHVYFYHVK